MSAFAAINFVTTSTWPFHDESWSGDLPFWEEVRAYEFNRNLNTIQTPGATTVTRPLYGHKEKHDERIWYGYWRYISSRPSQSRCLCKSTATWSAPNRRSDGNVSMGLVGDSFAVRRTRPKPTWHTGHVVSASGEQSRFFVEIPLEIVATIKWKVKCPKTSDQDSSSIVMNREEIRTRAAVFHRFHHCRFLRPECT